MRSPTWKSCQFRAIVASTAIILTIFGSTSRAVVTAPSSATGTTATYGNPTLLIDGTGLSGVGDILTQTHTVTHTLGWLKNNTNPANNLVFSFGGTADLRGFHIWQYDQGTCCNGRGVQTFDMSFSTDGGGTYPTTLSFSLDSSLAVGGAELPQSQPFRPQLGVTHVKFDNMTDFPFLAGPGWQGLAEIRFETAAATTTPAAGGARFDPGDFASLGTLNLSSGSVTFNTSDLSVSGGFAGTGAVGTTAAGTEVAVFTFDDVDLLSGVTVNLTGDRPVALLSKSDLTLGTTIDLSGASGTTTYASAIGSLGGFFGGSSRLTTTDGTNGPGRGAAATGGFSGGGGGANGGTGGNGELHANQLNLGGVGGSLHNDDAISDLFGGGGGGGSHWTSNIQLSSGGAGGGAIALGASGDIDILGTGGIVANGGAGGNGNTGGGGGAGGSIRFDAGGIFNNAGSISAIGGAGAGPTVDGGGGGGGRVAISAVSFVQGAIDVSGGGSGPFASDGGTGTIVTTVIPEPSTFALAALGLFGLLGWRRRRRR